MAFILMTEGEYSSGPAHPTGALARLFHLFRGQETGESRAIWRRESSQPGPVRQAGSYLQSQGHTVGVVDTVAMARETLSTTCPDVLVLHWSAMRDGLPFDVLEALAELQPANRTRVVFVTMMNPMGEPMRLTDDLVDAYVLWSCSFWQIVLTVEQLSRPDRFRCDAQVPPTE